MTTTTDKEKKQQKAYQKWLKVGLLNGIDDEFYAKQVASVLGNQAEKIPESKRRNDYFNKINIPLVRRVMGRLNARHWVSIQAMLNQTCMIWYFDGYGVVRRSELSAKARMLETVLKEPEEDVDLDKQAEVAADIAERIASEIDQEVLKDLRNVAKVKLTHEYKTPEDLLGYLWVVSAKIQGGANWIIVNPKVAKSLESLEEFEEYSSQQGDIYCLGKLADKWHVYVDSFSVEDCLLLGFRGQAFDSGYFYCPYIQLFQAEDNAGKDIKLATWYDKKLISNGESYYGLVYLENYSYDEEEGDENENSDSNSSEE